MQDKELDMNIKKKRGLIRQIRKDIVLKILGFLTAFIITFTFVFGVTLAPSNDMFPAVHEGDVILYYRLGGLINTDIAVYEADSEVNIGRVQATSGAVIDRTDGGLLRINGNIQPIQKRSGLYYKTFVRENGNMHYPSEVPDKAYLLLGDNREEAEDSRDYGFISKKDIKGKVFTIFRRRPL